ncbi:hypothetical protein BB561_003051 [Smittium simulii]|uniref:Uncharacterized protein n=1 Tax=Smittium simulii TaxID=133385 RepID=A0A2T9YN56_9FUNG|nr:hypothetical protein BB561_003051 [Smittium simulii]
MGYYFTAVNETTSTTAKKVDSVLYILQETLANITSSIGLFLHQKLLNNPEILPEDNNIVFAHTIRVSLLDLATTILQLRMYTIHREMNLAGKQPHTSEPEAFDALVTAKNATRRTGLRIPFQRRQQFFFPHTFHQNFAPVIGIGDITENTDFGILRQSPYYSSKDQELTQRSAKTHKSRKDTLMYIGKLYRKAKSNVSSSSYKPLNAETSLRAQKQITSKMEYMDIISHFYRANNIELNAIKNLISNMKQTVISASNFKSNFFTDYSNTAWGIVAGPLIFLETLCADILRKYYYAFITKKIWGYDFTQISRDSRKCLEILPKNKYSTTSDLSTVNIKPSGSPSRPQGSRAKCLSTQLLIKSKFILLSILKPDNTSNQKGTSEENNADNYNSVLKDCNMALIFTGTVYPTTIASTSNHNDSKPKKQKVTLLEKQALVLHDMGD